MRVTFLLLVALLASCASEPPALAPAATKAADPRPKAETPSSSTDLVDLSLAAMRLQAQMDRQLQEYQQRPRKKFIGGRPVEDPFSHYEQEWKAKIERVGNENYPSEARGTTYGSLRLTVTVRPDGAVQSIELDRSSGHKVLDEAAVRIVKLASPFAPFPPEIARSYDLLVITRTWFFGRSNELKAE